MGRNAAVIGCFAVSMIAVGVASGTAVPVAYGSGELTPSVGITGIISTLTALLSSAGGIFALFKSDTIKDFAKGVVGNIQQGDTHGTGVDAAFIAIATALILKKKTIDPTLLSQLGEVRNKVQVELDAK